MIEPVQQFNQCFVGTLQFINVRLNDIFTPNRILSINQRDLRLFSALSNQSTMLATGERPRQLHWYHAGPMLFGDWGTSRLYVLGIAFFHAQYSSIWFMLAMSLLLVGVGWAYEIICRHYPEGGGVYSAARHRSEFLGVVGALLLCADYVVTASLSALDAFHYLHLPYPQYWAAGGILLIGVINYFGPTKAGMIALVVALATVVCSSLIAIYAAPHLGAVQITHTKGTMTSWWTQFTGLILAISGVEAVANMTGIMVKPVKRTARLSIYPVLAEIVILNLILTLAMQAIPGEVLGIDDPEKLKHSRDTMLRVMSEYYIGETFAAVASLIFAGLLLSAVNTAITDLVSIQYMMAHDREIPRVFTGLNRYGMPVVGLIVGTVVPLITVLVVPDVGHLADLYAIGVVGAVAINLTACSTNFEMDLRSWERWPMLLLAVLMIAIWCTIGYQKPHALMFAGSIMVVGLVARYVARNYRDIGKWLLAPIPSYLPGSDSASPQDLSRLTYRGADLVPATEIAATNTTLQKYMVCTHGNKKLLASAFELAKASNAEMFVLFVRHIAVQTMSPLGPNRGEEDQDAIALFQQAREEAEKHGVKVYCLYSISHDVADTILDFAVTHGVSRLIMGASQRGGLWRAMKGDVIQTVAQYLPESIQMMILA
jgi:amino acid transporter/nucleotide-binding universal stress UspA family protein